MENVILIWNYDPKFGLMIQNVSNSGIKQSGSARLIGQFFMWSNFKSLLENFKEQKISFFFQKAIQKYSDREWMSYDEPIYEFLNERDALITSQYMQVNRLRFKQFPLQSQRLKVTFNVILNAYCPPGVGTHVHRPSSKSDLIRINIKI